MLKILKRISIALCAITLIALVAAPAIKTVYAADANETEVVLAADENADTTADESKDDAKGSKAIAAAIAVGLAAAAGALAMGISIAKSNEAIARGDVSDKVRTYARIGIHRNRDNLRPDSGYSGNIRFVKVKHV